MVCKVWRSKEKPRWDWSLLRGGIVNLIPEYKITLQTLRVPSLEYPSLLFGLASGRPSAPASNGDHRRMACEFFMPLFPLLRGLPSLLLNQWGDTLCGSAATWPPCTLLCVGAAPAYGKLWREFLMLECAGWRGKVLVALLRACPLWSARVRADECARALRRVTFHSRAWPPP